MEMTRKEKRKERKKMKRKQLRKEAAEMEREAEEARLNDPEELNRLEREGEEESERRERALKEFEERERAWIEAMERKRQEEEEEEEENTRKDLEEKAMGEEVEKDNEDDDWEYVEEGPAEIIWQGNEIIVRKKKVRVPKKESKQEHADSDRPTSNPLPPQSDAFADYLNASSAQHVLETVAKEVPNFGTEQDKAHCPFHLKTGACRFGQRCSRVHFYPDKSCTLLIRNMYTGPGLAWDQDEGLEHTDEDVERSYEEFYEDVHTEFLKFGEIVNFKVCKNGSFHLRGNVYVHYKSLESSVLAYHSNNGRYFASKPLQCEFVNITKWKVAICGEFMKSRFKTCSHGSACNFIHCFRNPGGDYEWADWDKPPPRYWVKKMGALFGYSDESSKMITSEAQSFHRSREMDNILSDSGRSCDNEDDIRVSIGQKRHINDERKYSKGLDERLGEERKSYKHNYLKRRVDTSDGSCSDMDMDGYRDGKRVQPSNRTKKSSKYQGEVLDFSIHDEVSKDRTSESDSGGDSLDKYGGRRTSRTDLGCTKKISRHRRKREFQDNDGDSGNKTYKDDGGQLNRNKTIEIHGDRTRKSSQHQMELESPDEQRDSKGSIHESDSSEMESSRDRDKKRRHSHRRRHSGHGYKVLEVHDDDPGSTKFGPHGSHSCDDGFDLEKEVRRSRTSSHSQHSNELLEQQAKKLKGKSEVKGYGHPSSRHRAGIETNEGVCHCEGVKSGGKCDLDGFKSHDLERNNLENLGDLDRWKPQKGLDEGVSALDRWKPESPEERAATAYRSGSRDHSQSGYKRHSKHMEKETDSSKEYGEKHHNERGSRRRKKRLP